VSYLWESRYRTYSGQGQKGFLFDGQGRLRRCATAHLAASGGLEATLRHAPTKGQRYLVSIASLADANMGVRRSSRGWHLRLGHV
jgi:hypothetical protein